MSVLTVDVEKGERVLALIKEFQLERGYRSEELARRALELLRDLGYIRWYRATPRGSSLDLFGVDYQLQDSWLNEHDLQVKSSARKARDHRMRFPLVPCIVVQSQMTPEQVSALIIREIPLPPP